jgi:hypothetical protein
LIGPDGVSRLPISAGAQWANFIVGPDWPAGAYHDSTTDGQVPLFWVAENGRDFEVKEAIPQPVEANFEGKIKLLGYKLPVRQVEPGGGLPLTLYWQGLGWLGEEFVIFTRLLDNQQVAWGGYDRLAQENYSTLLWAPGEVIVDGFAVPVAADAPDGIYTLNIGWYRKVDGRSASLAILNPETEEATDTTAVVIGPIKVGGPPAGATVAQASPPHLANVALGEQIELLGFELKATPPQKDTEQVATPDKPFLISPSQSLDISLYWQATGTPELDYTVFVHVRDEQGQVVAQKDSPPLNGMYPTGLWATGEVIKDRLELSLAQVEPGRYEVVVGMYDFGTGQRLTVDGSPDGTILLAAIQLD